MATSSPGIPKPLVKVGDSPILEIIVRQLRAHGFDRLTICISHLGDQIQQAIGDGRRFGLSVAYSWDHTPLGTAGPLGKVAEFNEPALVMNADILTTANLARLVAAHRCEGAMMTVAVRRCPVPVAFGVLLTDESDRVTDVEEKPSLTIDVVAGMYVADPTVVKYLPANSPLDMPELIRLLIAAGQPVCAHRFTDTWHDIGTLDNLAQAELDFLANRRRFFGLSGEW